MRYGIGPIKSKSRKHRPNCSAPWHNCGLSSVCARDARTSANGVFMQHLSVVILAAGQGKRMNSDLPKVLQPLAGQPLLQHVINAARGVDPDNIYVVYGHGGALVQAALAQENVE